MSGEEKTWYLFKHIHETNWEIKDEATEFEVRKQIKFKGFETYTPLLKQDFVLGYIIAINGKFGEEKAAYLKVNDFKYFNRACTASVYFEEPLEVKESQRVTILLGGSNVRGKSFYSGNNIVDGLYQEGDYSFNKDLQYPGLVTFHDLDYD